MNGRILLVYPHNFLQKGMGTNNRVYELVKIFNQLGKQVDIFAFSNFMEGSNFDNFDKENEEQLVNKLYIYNYNKTRTFVNKIKHKIERFVNIVNKRYLRTWTTADMKKEFDKVIEENDYSCIMTFYTYLAPLFIDIPKEIKKICFIEDSAFLQQFTENRTNHDNQYTLGQLLDSDLNYVRMFDHVFCISYDEKIMYSKMLGKKIEFLPHLMPPKISKQIPFSDKKYDLFFIGFDNPYNREALEWFLNTVYDNVDESVNILLAGSMTNGIQTLNKYNNITICSYIDDLEETYANVKVVMCPMFHGTGMKIKVVEAMQMGIPVICTERGVDGLPDKIESGCLVTDDSVKFADLINKLSRDEQYHKECSHKISEYYKKVFDNDTYLKELQDAIETNRKIGY